MAIDGNLGFFVNCVLNENQNIELSLKEIEQWRSKKQK
jgi:hypothetical protein